MPYTFQGISTMSSALRAAQTQLDVTGENLANVDSVGFHRRKVSLAQNPYTEVTVGRTVEIGNGVSVVAVSRVRDMFLAGRRTEAEAKMGRQEEGLTGLSKVQSAMLEPGDQGISSAYDEFNNAWSALSASPGSLAAKSDVRAAGSKLATRVSSLATDLQSQRYDSITRTKEILGKIDAAASKISTLNKEIAQARARGGEPNSLLDTRDKVVQELSGLADVTVTAGDGNIDVSLNGYRLVDPSGARTLSSNYDIDTGRILDGSSSFPVNGGALAGAFDTRQSIDSTSARLDTFADTLRAQVNSLFSTGKTANGVTGGTFFEEPTAPATSISALDFKLSAAVEANANAIPSGTSGLSGDGILAAQISSLRDSKVAGLGNQTVGAFYADIVTDVASRTAAAQDGVDTQDAVIQQLDAQISSTDGVSMDDEMANLLRFQRSYQAAAKALATFDQMAETIINMLNR